MTNRSAFDRTAASRVQGVGRQVRALRKERSMTLTQLGQRSGLSVAFLSQVENDRATPSLESLAAIAAALDCEESDILAAASARRNVAVTRSPGRPAATGSVVAAVDRELTGLPDAVQVQEHHRNADSAGTEGLHRNDCLVYVARGEVAVTVVLPAGTNVYQLAEGDSIACNAGVSYSWVALRDDTAVLTIRLAAGPGRSRASAAPSVAG